MWALLGKILVATDSEKLPKVQNIAQSGHTEGPTQSDAFKCLSKNLKLLLL